MAEPLKARIDFSLTEPPKDPGILDEERKKHQQRCERTAVLLVHLLSGSYSMLHDASAMALQVAGAYVGTHTHGDRVNSSAAGMALSHQTSPPRTNTWPTSQAPPPHPHPPHPQNLVTLPLPPQGRAVWHWVSRSLAAQGISA
jgi:hypothetical protein